MMAYGTSRHQFCFRRMPIHHTQRADYHIGALWCVNLDRTWLCMKSTQSRHSSHRQLYTEMYVFSSPLFNRWTFAIVFVRHSVRLITLCSAYYSNSSETTHGIVLKLHIFIGTGLEMVLNEICSDRENKMAVRQPFWIFNNMNYHIIENKRPMGPWDAHMIIHG